MSINPSSRKVQGKAVIFQIVETAESRESKSSNFRKETPLKTYRSSSPPVSKTQPPVSKTEVQIRSSTGNEIESSFSPEITANSLQSPHAIHEICSPKAINPERFFSTEASLKSSLISSVISPASKILPKKRPSTYINHQKISSKASVKSPPTFVSMEKLPLLLKTTVIKERYLQPKDVYGLFIDNTNLNSLPRNCFGTLIAYSLEQVKVSKKKIYNLGVLLYLHPYSAIIAPIISSHPSQQYVISNSIVTIDFQQDNCLSNIIYLNRIVETTCGNDGFIESNPTGPDVLFHIDTVPSSSLVKEKYLLSCNQFPKMYSRHPRHQLMCCKQMRRNPFSDSDIIKLRNVRVLDTEDMPSICVTPRDLTKNLRNKPGYAFAYPTVTNVSTPLITFAFLSHENASTLIIQKTVTKERYRAFLDQFAMYKESYHAYYVGDKGISFDECDSTMNSYTVAGHVNHINDMKTNKLHLRTKGRLHGLWKPCDTFEITDVAMLRKLISRTYGNFGVARSKSKCFGVNIYVGKKNADYVRPTPKMSESSIHMSEYYREKFDPTLHPVLYKLVNELTSQAINFQKSVDPVFDRFLLESLYVNQEANISDGESIKKRLVKQRRFAGLSIITCGNLGIIGFANIGHVDNDYITFHANEKLLDVLNKLLLEHETNGKGYIKDILLHLRNKYITKKRFSTYTTCGYKVFMSQKKGDSFKKLRAYFIYNSLLVVVEIPNDKSCYHTFDASYHNHQTSVPFVETDTHIIFNDESTFIFAWGNGKSERRQWMEDRGFVCNGRATNALITDFFNRLSEEDQSNMQAQRWVP